jgi:hypothetical protein
VWAGRSSRRGCDLCREWIEVLRHSYPLTALLILGEWGNGGVRSRWPTST